MRDPFANVSGSAGDMVSWQKVALAAIACLTLAGIIYVLSRAHMGDKRVKYILSSPLSLDDKKGKVIVAQDVLPPINVDGDKQWSLCFWVHLKEDKNNSEKFKTIFVVGDNNNRPVLRVARHKNTAHILVALRKDMPPDGVTTGESETEKAFEKHMSGHIPLEISRADFEDGPYSVISFDAISINTWMMLTLRVSNNTVTLLRDEASLKSTRTYRNSYRNLRGDNVYFAFGGMGEDIPEQYANCQISAVRFINYPLENEEIKKIYRRGYMGSKFLGLFNLPSIRLQSPIAVGR